MRVIILVFELLHQRTLGDDVAGSGQLTDQNLAGVADLFGFDVFVALGILQNRVNVHAALVSKSGGTDKGLMVRQGQVRDFVNVSRDFGQLLNMAGAWQCCETEFEHQCPE